MDGSFGPFVIDFASARLLRDGAEIRLRPRAFRVLRVLLQHRGAPVGYEQMLAEAWDGAFVSPHTINVTVAEVRKSLGEFAGWIVTRPKVGFSLDVPASDELVRLGWHFCDQRTREGGLRAVEHFRRAVDECSSDFRAWEGLSAAYLMLATFGVCPPRAMVACFITAHERAVALGGLRPELRCNRALATHLFEGRVDEAERELRAVIAAKPAYVIAHVRLAMLLGAGGRYDEALAVLAEGRQADLVLPTLAVTETVVHVWRGDFATAIDVGARTVELHPYQQIARAIYAEALRWGGRAADALAQYRQAVVLSPDVPWLRALEGACLADAGRHDDARACLDELTALQAHEYVDGYHLSALRLALGDRDGARAELAQAFDENSAWLYAIDVDPKMAALRGDPRVRRLIDRRLSRS